MGPIKRKRASIGQDISKDKSLPVGKSGKKESLASIDKGGVMPKSSKSGARVNN